MSKTSERTAGSSSTVTMDDVRRFSDSVEILDPEAFVAELQALVEECLESVNEPETLERSLSHKASALRADTRWVPGNTDIQRGRAVLLDTFEQPHNLPLPAFARLANKSRQQIYKDIEARRLLALNVGRRGQKLPDWQLDAVKQRLTQAVLQRASEVDAWTLYRALSEPLEGLEGRSPVEAVDADSVDAVAKAVFNALGMY